MTGVVRLARGLGWFSLGLGSAEMVLPAALRRQLGLRQEAWLVRAFGAREIAAGIGVLARPASPAGPLARVAGDAMDIAVLLGALGRTNPRRRVAQVAFALVLGVTALDLWCAGTLAARPGITGRASSGRRAGIGEMPT